MTTRPDKEQRRISRLLAEMREELDGFVFTAARNWQRSLKVDAEKRGLLRLAIVQFEILRARNAAKDTAPRT